MVPRLITYLVDEIRYEGDGLDLVEMVVFCGEHQEDGLDVVQDLDKNARVGVEEAQSYPLENEVQVGDRGVALLNNLWGQGKMVAMAI